MTPQITESQLKHIFLQQKQGLPLNIKIEMAKRRIRQWYEAWDGNVYVSFSGGLDSTILLQIVRSVYPGVTAVFVDTGLEFPEIREFVRTVPNVIWLKPRYSFKQVCERWGYPVWSKKVAMSFDRYRNTKSDVQKALRLASGVNPTTGKWQTKGVIPKCAQYLLDAPFKISDHCCAVLKHQPLDAFERKTGSKAFVGTMAIDSKPRKDEVIKSGCNAFKASKPTSRPMSFFTEADIKRLKTIIPHSRIYEMGYESTGCMLCMFGLQQEIKKGKKNRFLLLKETHPRIHEKALPAFGIDKILDYMGVPYK